MRNDFGMFQFNANQVPNEFVFRFASLYENVTIKAYNNWKLKINKAKEMTQWVTPLTSVRQYSDKCVMILECFNWTSIKFRMKANCLADRAVL